MNAPSHYDVTVTLADSEHPEAKATFVLERQPREKLLDMELLGLLVREYERRNGNDEGK